jgi:hypothetical protein
MKAMNNLQKRFREGDLNLKDRGRHGRTEKWGGRGTAPFIELKTQSHKRNLQRKISALLQINFEL